MVNFYFILDVFIFRVFCFELRFFFLNMGFFGRIIVFFVYLFDLGCFGFWLLREFVCFFGEGWLCGFYGVCFFGEVSGVGGWFVIRELKVFF